MTVRSILEEKGRDVFTIGPDETLAAAIRLLAEKRIGAVVVLRPDGGVGGILSERDVVRALAEGGADALGRKVTPYEWHKEIVTGLLPIDTIGHTPGHTSFVLSSGNDKVFIQSDVTNNPDLFARNPGWHVFYDQIPDVAGEAL